MIRGWEIIARLGRQRRDHLMFSALCVPHARTVRTISVRTYVRVYAGSWDDRCSNRIESIGSSKESVEAQG